MEETLYDTNGNPIAYIAHSDDETIYLWDGKPVAYLCDDNIYGFNGNHLGWFEDGIVRDRDGYVVGFNKTAANVFVAFEPIKSFKEFKPFKSFKEFAPFKPFYSTSYSDVNLLDFLGEGV